MTAPGVACWMIAYMVESFESTQSLVDGLGHPTRMTSAVYIAILDNEFHEYIRG